MRSLTAPPPPCPNLAAVMALHSMFKGLKDIGFLVESKQDLMGGPPLPPRFPPMPTAAPVAMFCNSCGDTFGSGGVGSHKCKATGSSGAGGRAVGSKKRWRGLYASNECNYVTFRYADSPEALPKTITDVYPIMRGTFTVHAERVECSNLGPNAFVIRDGPKYELNRAHEKFTLSLLEYTQAD